MDLQNGGILPQCYMVSQSRRLLEAGKISIERIVLLDFIHHLVSQKTNKIEELKI
jgi:hypothetical protein